MDPAIQGFLTDYDPNLAVNRPPWQLVDFRHTQFFLQPPIRAWWTRLEQSPVYHMGDFLHEKYFDWFYDMMAADFPRFRNQRVDTASDMQSYTLPRLVNGEPIEFIPITTYQVRFLGPDNVDTQKQFGFLVKGLPFYIFWGRDDGYVRVGPGQYQRPGRPRRDPNLEPDRGVPATPNLIWGNTAARWVGLFQNHPTMEVPLRNAGTYRRPSARWNLNVSLNMRHLFSQQVLLPHQDDHIDVQRHNWDRFHYWMRSLPQSDQDRIIMGHVFEQSYTGWLHDVLLADQEDPELFNDV